jgi:hypothetical protein
LPLICMEKSFRHDHDQDKGKGYRLIVKQLDGKH